MRREVGPVLDEMLLTIGVIEAALVDRTREDFGNDAILRLAVQRAIEIISEASRHIPDELLQRAPHIPWRSIRGMGNILRHEYHRIADDIIWHVAIDDLPRLKAVLSLHSMTAQR
ncbi:HepT-like ribonuclease domain-containing protein [Mycoplana dimorpha]|uniref:Uncharacterized protein with HEPN domain n=1 Tax=Mycoplana dimorpha TaxID=28320 RepID=A0A2T5BHN9_MYCDI|nr:HepT-like ribonuclease domain-containing protein [Mycoplana dimorpha]PTM98517.1 uncharacterized protein with HEPN domain [Mycoplana dimorpha]